MLFPGPLTCRRFLFFSLVLFSVNCSEEQYWLSVYVLLSRLRSFDDLLLLRAPDEDALGGGPCFKLNSHGWRVWNVAPSAALIQSLLPLDWRLCAVVLRSLSCPRCCRLQPKNLHQRRHPRFDLENEPVFLKDNATFHFLFLAARHYTKLESVFLLSSNQMYMDITRSFVFVLVFRQFVQSLLPHRL